MVETLQSKDGLELYFNQEVSFGTVKDEFEKVRLKFSAMSLATSEIQESHVVEVLQESVCHLFDSKLWGVECNS